MSVSGNSRISGKFDVGTSANDVVALDASGKLPAVDGSQLTNISGGGGGANTDLSNLIATEINQDLISDQSGSIPVTIFSNFPGNSGQGDYTFSTAGTQSVATSFTPGSSISAAGASFASENTPATLAGNIFAQIWSDSGGLPNTMLGQSDSILANTLNAGQDQVDFTFSTAVSLTSGTPYWVAVTGDSTYIGNTGQLQWIGVISTSGLAFKSSDTAWHTPGAPTPAVMLITLTEVANNLGSSGNAWQDVYINNAIVDNAGIGALLIANRAIKDSSDILSIAGDDRTLSADDSGSPLTQLDWSTPNHVIPGNKFTHGLGSGVKPWSAVISNNFSLTANNSGSTNGTLSIVAPTAITDYTVIVPNAQGPGALTNDGSGNLSWTPGGGSGATPALDNLASVEINTTLNFATTVPGVLKSNDEASAPTYPMLITTGDSGNNNSGNITIQPGMSNGGAFGGYVTITSGLTSVGLGTGPVNIGSADVSGAANSGNVSIRTGDVDTNNSGNIYLATGTAAATRGFVSIDALYLGLPQAAADFTAPEGSIYYNTTLHAIKLYNGTTWQTITAV